MLLPVSGILILEDILVFRDWAQRTYSCLHNVGRPVDVWGNCFKQKTGAILC